MKTTALVFACHSAVCAPPPAGTGGSLKVQGAVGRVATRLALKLQKSRDQALSRRAEHPAEIHSEGRITHVAGMGQVTVTPRPPSAVKAGHIVLHNLRGWKVTNVKGGAYRGERVITISDPKGNKDEVFVPLGDNIYVIS